ncbi:M48 family metalloprotease [Neptunitalea lumnitzerae]|uniref:Peptidase M48 domain-containing protein n=1 Tax=Neptunitalea lumnitzerae TaxID=2965509 RepID=A0ABQ5MJ05_9FLAO|nr:hypothetical protein [Neptunitalea sp. Y10]GLB49395.1 hypothetical protein Y10_17630 [Neptunitalea sp. Y10]
MKEKFKEILKDKNFILNTEVLENLKPEYLDELESALSKHPDFENIKDNYIIDKQNNTLIQILERIPISEVEDLTDEQRFYYPMCNKSEIKRIFNVKNSDDFLLKYRADQIADDVRLTRVFLKIRTNSINWNFSNYFDSSFFNNYIETLPNTEKNKCKEISFGTIYLKEANGYCMKTDFGNIIVISFALRYFLYYMNLFHLGPQYNLNSQDISNAFLIAVRTMLGTESLDFELDNRGDIPEELHLEIESMVDGQMMFVIGHEFAHHYLDHLEQASLGYLKVTSTDKNTPFYNYSQKRELEADYNSVMKPEIPNEERNLIANGAFTFFIWLDLFKSVKEYIFPPSSLMKSHPNPIDRIWELRKKLNDEIGVTKEQLLSLVESYKPFKENLIKDLPYQIHIFEYYGSLYLSSQKKITHDRLNF